MKFNKKRGIQVLLLLVLFTVPSLLVFAHDTEPPDHPVHQYISKEAQYVWNQTPYEIKQNIGRYSYIEDLDIWGYNSKERENILIGSGEEDTQLVGKCLTEVVGAILYYDPYLGYEAAKQLAKPFCEHFWDPDNLVKQK